MKETLAVIVRYFLAILCNAPNSNPKLLSLNKYYLWNIQFFWWYILRPVTYTIQRWSYKMPYPEPMLSSEYIPPPRLYAPVIWEPIRLPNLSLPIYKFLL